MQNLCNIQISDGWPGWFENVRAEGARGGEEGAQFVSESSNAYMHRPPSTIPP